MLTWKKQDERYGGGDSCFGAEFAKAEPGIAKQLSNASGAFEDKKTATVNGYSYKVKIVPKKDGSGSYTFIERKQTFVGLGDEKPEQVAHKAVQQEYSSEGAKQGHLENVAMHKEMLTALQKFTVELIVNTGAQKENTAGALVLANELQGLKQLLQIIAQDSVAKNAFKTAAVEKTQ